MLSHSITMLGTGLIGDFYTQTLHGQRFRRQSLSANHILTALQLRASLQHRSGAVAVPEENRKGAAVGAPRLGKLAGPFFGRS